MRKGLIAAVVCAGVLSGCSGDDWFGEPDAPPLPGDRLSVLALENQLKPDIAADELNIVLPAPETNVDWPQAGGLSHHAMAHLQIAETLTPVWTTSIGTASADENRLLASPVIGDGRIYTVDSLGHVSAFDANNGATIWRMNLTPKADKEGVVLGGGLAYDKGRLFATTGVGELWALQTETGNFYWKATMDAPMRAAPTVYGERVFVVTADNKVTAFSARDGKKLWDYVGATEMTGLLGAASPAADNGVLVVAMRNGALAALRVESGSLLWEDTLSAGRKAMGLDSFTDIKAAPVMANGRVFAVGNADTVAAIDLRSGRRMWDKSIGGTNMPWVAGDYLFMLSNDNELVALEARSGNIAWVTQLSSWTDPEDKKGRIIWGGPILASDRLLIVGSHGYALSVSPYDGKVLGYSKLSDGATIPPVVANGTVYFLTDEADLVAYR